MEFGLDPQALGAVVYIVHAALFGAGVGLVLLADRRGARPRDILARSAVVAGVTGAFVFMMSDTRFPFEDFREAYWRAGRAVLAGPGGLKPLFEQGVNGFVNLPILAYLFAPFGLLSPKLASLAFLGLGVASVALAWAMLVRAFNLSARDSGLALVGLAAFGPIHYSIREGNTSHFLIAVLVAGLVLARRRRDIAAGLVFGAAALLKPPLLLVGVYFALRGRWRIVAGGLAAVLATAGLSLALFGWETHVVWYRECIAPFSRHPMPAFNVQSLAATLSKLEHGAGGLNDWTSHPLSRPSLLIVQALTAALLGAAVWSAWRGGRRGAVEARDGEALECELMMVITLACLISPLSWSHYYSWLALPGAFLLAHSANADGPPLRRLALGVGWLLAAPPVFWHDTSALGGLAVLGNLHLLAGALVIFGALLQRRAELGPATVSLHGAGRPRLQG